MCVLTQLLSTVVGYAQLTGCDRRPPGVDLSTAGAPGASTSTRRRPSVDRRQPPRLTQLTPTTIGWRRPASNASNRLRQNGVNSDVKQRQISVKQRHQIGALLLACAVRTCARWPAWRLLFGVGGGVVLLFLSYPAGALLCSNKRP
jgi:hypothetical protein